MRKQNNVGGLFRNLSATRRTGRSLTALLCCAVLMTAALTTGCSNQNTPQESSTETQTGTREDTLPEITDGVYPAKPGYVKVLGRYFYWSETLWLSHSATGIEFTYDNCTSIDIQLKGDSTATASQEAHQARYAVYLNDVRVVDALMGEAERTVSLDMTDAPATGVVRVIKLSESSDSSIGIAAITVDGTISPTADKELSLEFIGDSITCGYGVDEGLDSVYSTSNEDATKTYAYKTATALNADYSMVSHSGHGIISGYTGDGTINTASLMPALYDKFGNSYGSIMSGIRPGTLNWDFSKYQPDYVIINLGTNDSSYCGTDASKQAEFVTGYVDFLKMVRENNPDATIICTLGIMGDTLYPSVEEAVSAYRTETGDTAVTSMRFDVQSAEDGYAVDYHPTEVTHEKAAQKLIEFIQSLEQ